MLLKIRKLRQNLAELVAKYGGPRPVAFLAGMPSKMEVEEELWKLANLPSYSCIKYYKVKRYLERQIDTYRVPESEIEGEEHFLCKIDRCKKKFRTVQGFLGHARNAHKAYSDTRTPCPEPGCVKYFQKDESLRNHVQSNDHHYSRLGYVCPMPSCAWKASTSDDAVVEHIVSYHHNTKAAEEYAQLKDIDINIVRAAREYYAVVQAEKERSELHSTWNAIAASRLPRKYVLRLA
ncbi:hypothetical protein SAICODRAFT_31274 [Saitoella complicata NRRL Y-17804]|nr:uncharacterized protein SAICODRAFT_31274 [Saitoella complicata NRRL Y-17804]ODQ51307.1 hypothetical protein SAICODRAFT_31274 [Saitoella complicata NRRL Y-17804]